MQCDGQSPALYCAAAHLQLELRKLVFLRTRLSTSCCSATAGVSWLAQAARSFCVKERIGRRAHTALAVLTGESSITLALGHVVFQLTDTIATANSAVGILGASLTTVGASKILVALADGSAVRRIEGTFSFATAHLATSGWANMAA